MGNIAKLFGVTTVAVLKEIDDGTCLFVTDEWGGFFRHSPPTGHFYEKDLTFPIEATHSNIRHRLGRFHRRSKITSRSRERGEIFLNIFQHLQNYWEQFLKVLYHSFGQVPHKFFN